MQKLQSQGVHHITLVGADRQTSIDFWEGILGMPFIFEQPNLDQPAESHLYFDPGDGRLITIFTNENRKPDPTPTPNEIGAVHHIAFWVSRSTFAQAVERLDRRYVEAAHDLGANDWRAFWRVVWPLTLPGVVAGSMLVFIPAVGAFVTPDLMGGTRGLMIGNLVQSQFGGRGNVPLGSAISMVLLVFVFVGVLVYTRFGERER